MESRVPVGVEADTSRCWEAWRHAVWSGSSQCPRGAPGPSTVDGMEEAD